MTKAKTTRKTPTLKIVPEATLPEQPAASSDEEIGNRVTWLMDEIDHRAKKTSILSHEGLDDLGSKLLCDTEEDIERLVDALHARLPRKDIELHRSGYLQRGD